jgi:hypothetical protein
MTYFRLPTTPEQPFATAHFDMLMNTHRASDCMSLSLSLSIPIHLSKHTVIFYKLFSFEGHSHVIYNCQIGKGRSTNGMIVSLLIEIFSDEETLLQWKTMAQSSSQVTYDVAGKREQGVCFSK